MTMFSKIYHDKNQGKISREEYWKLAKDRFEILEEFDVFYQSSNISIEIVNGAAWVIYKILQNNEKIYFN